MTENSIGNPSPIGLFGFGFTTILLSLHNAGLIELSIVILAAAICFGGIAQLIAGIFEMKIGNTFGATIFVLFSFFWILIAMTWILPGIGPVQPGDSMALGSALVLFGCFTTAMFLSALKHAKILQVLCGLVTVLFFMLAAFDFTQIAIIQTLAGYLGIVLGAIALYASVGTIINTDWERDIFKL